MNIDAHLADKKAIACNYLVATRECVQGALAYVSFVTGGEVLKIEVLCRSRSGRWVKRWENLSTLANFRYKTIPPTHPLYEDPRVRFHWLDHQGKDSGWLHQLEMNSEWNRERDIKRAERKRVLRETS